MIGQLHVQLAVRAAVQGCDYLIRIHDLNILIYLNIGCSYNSLALELNIMQLLLRWLLLLLRDCKALQVHDDFCNVFFYSRDGAEFMKNTICILT